MFLIYEEIFNFIIRLYILSYNSSKIVENNKTLFNFKKFKNVILFNINLILNNVFHFDQKFLKFNINLILNNVLFNPKFKK